MIQKTTMLIRDHYNSGVMTYAPCWQNRKCTKKEQEKEFTLTLHPSKDSVTKVHSDASFHASLESTLFKISLLQLVLTV